MEILENTRLERGKQWMSSRLERMKPALQNQLRSKPVMWASVAVGLGFAAGLAGRIARRRRQRMTETFVIMEAC